MHHLKEDLIMLKKIVDFEIKLMNKMASFAINFMKATTRKMLVASSNNR